MEIKSDVTYPIEERKEEGRLVSIKAGDSWTDDNRIKQYEGVKFQIPKEISHLPEITFLVLGIKKKNHETYTLHLHSHDFKPEELNEHYNIPKSDEYSYIDAGGDVEVTLTVKKDIVSKWTGIPAGNVRRAFDTFTLGNTYNLLASLPRKIIVKEKEIVLVFGANFEKVDPMNVCNYLLKDSIR